MLKQSLMGLMLVLSLAAQAQTVAKVEINRANGKPARAAAKAPAHSPAEHEVTVLSPEQLAIARNVLVGKIPCELGATVTLTPDAHLAGRFILELGQQRYQVVPAVTTTGAVRLEDAVSGAVWIQLSNKSMLMNTKQGKRLADACMNPDQALVAQALERAPVPGLLDAPAAKAAVAIK